MRVIVYMLSLSVIIQCKIFTLVVMVCFERSILLCGGATVTRYML